MQRHLSGWLGSLMLISGVFVWGGCSNEPTGTAQPVIVPAEMLMMIEAAPRGIVMAVGDTQQITVQARNILGEPIPVDDSVTYTSANVARVTVSPTGLVQAMRTTQSATAEPAPVRVIVRWRHGPITRADSIYVLVTVRPAQPIIAMSIQPSPYPIDSTWLGNYATKNLAVKGFTASGDSVTNLYAYLYTDRRRQFVNEVVFPPTRSVGGSFSPGVFWVYATASIFGVPFQDSVQLTQLDPVHNLISPFRFVLNSAGVISTSFASGGTWFFSPCADVVFENWTTFPLTVTFDDPSHTGVCIAGDQTGNISLTAVGTAGARVTRKFPVAGLTRWTATRTDGTLLSVPLTGILSVRDHTYWNAVP